MDGDTLLHTDPSRHDQGFEKVKTKFRYAMNCLKSEALTPSD